MLVPSSMKEAGRSSTELPVSFGPRPERHDADLPERIRAISDCVRRCPLYRGIVDDAINPELMLDATYHARSPERAV